MHSRVREETKLNRAERDERNEFLDRVYTYGFSFFYYEMILFVFDTCLLLFSMFTLSICFLILHILFILTAFSQNIMSTTEEYGWFLVAIFGKVKYMFSKKINLVKSFLCSVKSNFYSVKKKLFGKKDFVRKN